MPPATEYLSSFVHLQNVSLPFVDNLIKKARFAGVSYRPALTFAQSQDDIKQLDVQLRYEDYAALFEKTGSGAVVERQRVLFEHFMSELQEVRGACSATSLVHLFVA